MALRKTVMTDTLFLPHRLTQQYTYTHAAAPATNKLWLCWSPVQLNQDPAGNMSRSTFDGQLHSCRRGTPLSLNVMCYDTNSALDNCEALWFDSRKEPGNIFSTPKQPHHPWAHPMATGDKATEESSCPQAIWSWRMRGAPPPLLHISPVLSGTWT